LTSIASLLAPTGGCRSESARCVPGV